MININNTTYPKTTGGSSCACTKLVVFSFTLIHSIQEGLLLTVAVLSIQTTGTTHIETREQEGNAVYTALIGL